MEVEVLSSGMDVTVLRASMLYDGKVTGNYRILGEENYYEELRIARADVAHFFVHKLTANKWINRVIAIADQ